MKPVLIVDGKELNVTNIYYSNGQVTMVQAEVEPNVYETYSHKDYLFVYDTDRVIDFDKALKFVGGHEDLIVELKNVMESFAVDLDDIAHDAMETLGESPFDLKYKQRQELYHETKMKMEGFSEATMIVQKFLADEK